VSPIVIPNAFGSIIHSSKKIFFYLILAVEYVVAHSVSVFGFILKTLSKHPKVVQYFVGDFE
jgi:hypothetical protein